MKTLRIIAMLLAVTAGCAWAQDKRPDRRPTPTAEGIPNSKAGTSDHMNASTKRTSTVRSQSDAEHAKSQSGGTTSRKNSKPKPVNQAAAGVPTNGSTDTSHSRKPNRNQ